MRAISQLLKLSLIRISGINVIRFSKSRGNQIRSIGIILAVLYTIGSLGSTFYFMLREVSRYLVIPQLTLLAASLFIASLCWFCLLFNTAGGSHQLFLGKDSDQLLALPIPARALVISRYLVLYFGNILVILTFLVPLLLIIIQNVPALRINWFMLVPAVLALPIIPGILGIGLSLFFHLLSKSVGKMRTRVLIAALFVAGILLFLKFLGLDLAAGFSLTNIWKILRQANKLTLFSQLFVDAVFLSRVSSFLILTGSSLLIGGLFLFLCGKYFMPITDRLQRVRKSAKAGHEAYRSSRPMTALIKREFKKYFSSFLVVSNSIIGTVMLTGFVIFLLFRRDLIQTILPLTGKYAENTTAIAAVIITLMIGMTDTAAFSISLEGKTFPLLKSFPVSPNQIFISKGILNFIITGVGLVISLPLLAFIFQMSLIDITLCALLGLSYMVLIPAFGLIGNLLFPNFTFDNEAIVVKQSTASFIGVFGGMLLGFLPVLIFVSPWNTTVSLGIILLISLGLNIVFIRILSGWGNRRFLSLF